MAEGLRKIKPEVVGATGLPSHYCERLADKISECSSWLLIRGNSSRVRIAASNYCRQPHLCGCCAAARSRRLVCSYLEKVRAVADECDGYMLTLTIPSIKGSTANFEGLSSAQVQAECQALRVGIDLCMSSWRKLWARKKVRGSGPLREVLGAVVGLEVTRGISGWHPHLHVLLMMPKGRWVSIREMRKEWHALTGGIQLDIRPVTGGLFGLVEVLKYSSKPVELKNGQEGSEGLFWRFLTYSVLKGRQCVFGYGNLRGVVESEDYSEGEDLSESEEQEFWFRWKSSLGSSSFGAYEAWDREDTMALSELLSLA